MKEMIIAGDKQKFLNEHYPFGEAPKLSDKMFCIHCEEMFTVGDFKVFKEEGDDFEYICCPNAPSCNGTVIDWIDEEDYSDYKIKNSR